MRLMGVDIGFSKTGETTGIACLDGNKLYLSKAGTSRESRMAQIPAGFQADVIALDGPLLPQGAGDLVRRRCESIFIRAPFSRRCKPGLSDFGFGLELRRAANEAYDQFSQVLATRERFVSSSGRIIEAFPNAFLAVLLPDENFQCAPKLRRGERFDWLYGCAIGTEAVKSALSKSLHLPREVWRRLRAETDHELRAALVCLLTAAFAARGTAKIIGEAESGWFWLPPLSLWQRWAKDGLGTAEEKWRSKRVTTGR